MGYAMFRIEGGRESSRHHHLWELVEQIRSFGIKEKYEIGDGAYDDREFYYIVNQMLGAEGIARYNPRRSGFKRIFDTIYKALHTAHK